MLETQAQAANNEADRLQATQAQRVAARIQPAEADISAGEARVALVRRRLSAQATRLAEQQQPFARLIAALQSIAPPAAGDRLVQPGSTDRYRPCPRRAGAIMPVIERRTAGFARELAGLRTTRQQQAVALGALGASRPQLARRQRLRWPGSRMKRGCARASS